MIAKPLQIGSFKEPQQPQATTVTSGGSGSFQQEIDNFKSISKCSNYDTVAMPISEQRKNPFKHKPGSL